ncbi:polar localization protein TipN [Phenylobacterium aquaticum]|uniref:polar localization protein TipN n=1 Tax=Phenylobacterium aquaticum TaxID=1763816 RepID=UPI0026F12B42|nr:polar localization protein TipN [Phenylobacterium aquaticum]
MKIKKRRQPADFQAMTDDGPAPESDGLAPDAAPDFDLDTAEPPQIAPAIEPPQASTPSQIAAEPKVATTASRPLATRPERTPPPPEPPIQRSDIPSGWPIYLAALFVSVLWACAPIAFAYGYQHARSPFDFDPFVLAVLSTMAVGPAAFVWVAAYMMRQGQLLALEARRAQALSDQMVGPALSAGAQATDVVRAVREEIARASVVADEARETLLALRQALASESEQLVEAAAHSARTAHDLAQTLGRERSELGGLAHTLDQQATAVSDSITQKARMVAEASDLAETQIREAEAALAARAADLAAAAGEASDAARTAGEDLTRHIARLETAGMGVADQISQVEQGLTEQRAGLVTTAHALRAEQEAFGAQSETHAAQLSEFITQARLSAAELGDRAVKGGEALRQLIAEAAEQFRELAASAAAERDEFGQSTLHSLEAVSEAAAQERAKLEAQTRAAIQGLAEAAEQTRTAAEQHAVTARDQVDQLSEAAFTAGQRANQVFEARLSEARDLIEQSAQMVEQAGAATARKLDEGAQAARATLDELAGMLAEIEARAARLPATARGQAEEVRQAVTESIDELMDYARKTANETQAIDQAFQDRVHRNYEMLSEAVRMMGSVAGAAGGMATPAPPRERPPRAERTPLARPVREQAPPVASERFAETFEDEDLDLELNEPVEEAPQRPRLRLTPTATDQEFTDVFDQAQGRSAPPTPSRERDGDEWTWKDLLTSIDDGGAAPGPDERALEDELATEIAGMGIDPTALLPRGRIDEIAAAIQTDDADGAREVVRRLAPAATRRLSRRLFTDDKLKRKAIAYLNRYQDLLADAAERDHEGFLVETLLSSDAGRIYLLLEAAAGDFV